MRTAEAQGQYSSWRTSSHADFAKACSCIGFAVEFATVLKQIFGMDKEAAESQLLKMQCRRCKHSMADHGSAKSDEVAIKSDSLY